MCIRDSIYIDDQSIHESFPVIIEVPEGSKNKYELDKETGPVSYTHLRAHETVLDLVCRLLLETKKDRPSTINYQHVITTTPNIRDTNTQHTS